MSSAALTVRDLRRSYGSTVALDGLDLTVPRGAVCGLVGPNGAGKTTTFAIIAGLVMADSGTVDVLGEGPFDPRRHAGRVTILPQDCALPEDVPVGLLLAWYGRLQGMSRSQAQDAADQVLDEVALRDRAGQKIKQLSHGMRRRVAVAQALLGSPELILLDEPTSGLDPDLVVRMRSVLKARAGTATLVISSHVLAELEATCDHVVFMEAGRAVAQGTLSEVTGQSQQVLVTLDGSAEPFLRALVDLPLSVSAQGASLRVSARAQLSSSQLSSGQLSSSQLSSSQINALLLPALLAAGAPVVSVVAGQSLEASWMASRRAATPDPVTG